LILLAAARHHHQFGLLMRSAGPQVRGGESVSILRIDTRPVPCIGDRIDMLAALDWRNIERFSDELPLDADSLILFDQAKGTVPSPIAGHGAQQREAAFGQRAAEQSGGRANMVAVGEVARRIGLPLGTVIAGVDEILANKDEDLRSAATACITASYGRTAAPAAVASRQECKRWRLSGNAAAGVGALRAGVDFVAAYPITPASEMLEWLSPRLERTGGSLVQAEDELAAVNMLVGASFGGVPALTATSGPGLSLMSEGIGLAIASETPIVVVDVARGGPSTGMPTKSEQADLDQALYGLHGDAPHLVLAPLSIEDCAYTVEWAVRLAERLQTAAIVVSDQALGQTQAIIDPPPRCPSVAARKLRPPTASRAQETPRASAEATERYTPSADGISPMPLPGDPGGMYTADGLTHDRRGTPSSSAADHLAHLEKLSHKLLAHDYGTVWARFDPSAARGQSQPPAEISLVTWGSSWGAAHEAATRLRQQGVRIQVIGLRLIAPLHTKELRDAIGYTRVLVVEVNASGQLFRHLNAQRALPATAESFARPGPLPLRPQEIIGRLAPLLEGAGRETDHNGPASQRHSGGSRGREGRS
jgi:2-oxoglutarate ferredoxin oxidoreductase subunit alpha